MANFYTYGRMPSAEDTVYGLAGLDQEPVYVPREESVPVAPLNEAPPPDFSGVDPGLIPQAPPSPFEAPSYVPRGEDVPISPLSSPAPSSTPLDSGVPKTDIFAAMKAFGAAPSIIAPLAQAGTGGKDLTAGDLFKNERERFVSDYEKQVAVLKAAGNFTPENDEALKATLNYHLDKLTKDETSYLNTLPQRQELSNLLKANKFSEAYQYAKDNGLQLLLTQPTELKNLRDPFTKEEARQFIRAMPEEFIKSAYGDRYKFDEAWTFDPEGAESRGALAWVAGMGPKGPVMSETGYPQLDRILQAKEVKKETGVFEKIFKAAALAAAVFGGAQALGALGGGAGAGAGALTGVTPTGLVPGTTAANLAAAKAAATGAGTLAGGAALPTFTVTAGGGLTGAQLAALGAAGAGVGGLGGGAGTAPTTTTPPPDNLQEILVQAAKPKPYSLLGPGTLASTSLIQGTPDVPVDIYGRPQGEPDLTEGKIEAAEQAQPLEEFIVRAPSILSPLAISAGAAVPALSQMLPQGSFGQPQTLQEPSALEGQIDKIQEALKTGAPIPGTLAARIAQLSELGGNLSNASKLAKLLGLGAGAATVRGLGAAAPVTGAGGFGGALPKFQLQRTPLQPQVDYYRYGLGPEARFFEDKLAEVPPSEYETTRGPDAGIVNPKDRPPVFAEGGLAKGGRYMEGPGSGRDDKIPALLSDGEYVIDAETLALLGDGSPKEGAKRMDKFRANIRRHKGDALSRGRISPDAKSPSKYMGGGLTR